MPSSLTFLENHAVRLCDQRQLALGVAGVDDAKIVFRTPADHDVPGDGAGRVRSGSNIPPEVKLDGIPQAHLEAHRRRA